MVHIHITELTDLTMHYAKQGWSLGLEVSVSRHYFGTSRSRENLVRSWSRSRLSPKVSVFGLNVSFYSSFSTTKVH